MMQAFASVYGLTALQSIEPTDYQASKPVELTIAIDKTAHTMARVTFAQANFVETYSDYGLHNSVMLPTATISTTQLQKRLDAVQQ